MAMKPKNSSSSAALKRYGLVALAFLHIAVGRGLHGTFGVFFSSPCWMPSVWSRATTAGAISLAIIFEGACLPWAGGLIDRIGGRKTLIFGGVVLAIGLSFASTIASIWHLYFWIGIVAAMGIALIGMVPHVAIITRAFPERKGTALGIAWAGGGVGIVLLVPATQLMIDRWGWSTAYIGLAAMTALLVIPPVLFFLPRDAKAGGTSSCRGEICYGSIVRSRLDGQAGANQFGVLAFIHCPDAGEPGQSSHRHAPNRPRCRRWLQQSIRSVDFRFHGSRQHRRAHSLRLSRRRHESSNGLYRGTDYFRLWHLRAARVIRRVVALAALQLCDVLRTGARFARLGFVGDFRRHFSRSTFWRDLRLLYI